jgi:sugar O-acyltransferase (sialic acid O-acetyltransferase NeuD family)
VSKIIIFGNSTLASLAYVYLKHDSPHEPIAFTVDSTKLTTDRHLELPVVSFDEIEKSYPPDEFEMFLPISFRQMSHLRANKYFAAKAKGYTLISYISSKATIWPGFICGDNCFILEDNTIQPFATIGNDVVMWSGNHIGHHSVIKDHVFITSHVVVSGACTIEPHCFLGVNATIREETILARETLVGAGALILRDTKEFEVYKAEGTQPAKIRSDQLPSISHKSAG